MNDTTAWYYYTRLTSGVWVFCVVIVLRFLYHMYMESVLYGTKGVVAELLKVKNSCVRVETLPVLSVTECHWCLTGSLVYMSWDVWSNVKTRYVLGTVCTIVSTLPLALCDLVFMCFRFYSGRDLYIIWINQWLLQGMSISHLCTNYYNTNTLICVHKDTGASCHLLKVSQGLYQNNYEGQHFSYVYSVFPTVWCLCFKIIEMNYNIH